MIKNVEATTDGQKIMVRFPYDDDLVERVKAVGGGRWRKADKCWAFPLSLDICHGLRAQFGSSLLVADPLREWYRAETARADQRAQTARRGDATLTRLPQSAPKLASTLRADQRAAAVWLAEGWLGGALLADHPGTGKTLCTIAGILESGATGPILITCPRLSVRAVWQRELERWTDERVYAARGTRKQREKVIAEFLEDPAERKWLITVSETLRVIEEPDEEDKIKIVGYEYPQLFGVDWSWVAVDESHKMFGSLTVVKGNLAGKGLSRLKISGRRMAITGTPFGKGGRIPGMFGTLHWLWPKEFTSYWRWVDQHFEVEEKKVSRTRVVKQIGKLKHGKDEEHFLASLGPRMLRRTKAEVLPHLPPKTYQEVWCEMSPAQAKQYRTLADDAEVVGKSGFTTADGVLAMITRGKQVASGLLDVDQETGDVFFTDDSCKVDMLFEKLETRGVLSGDGDLKVIIASQFNELLKVVTARLDKAGVSYGMITGAVNDRKRDEAMEAFQNDPSLRVMILNSKAGGVSVTLDAADELHMLDEMWDPGDNEQLEDRIHRASRVHFATIIRYRTEGTLDERIAMDVENKRFEQHRVLDASRDIAFAQTLLRG